SEANRAARERGAARAEALPSSGDELVRAELLREVVEAVLALDEPYRSTILARYFHDRDAARIARESGVPAATVRSREQRALEQLRARLDRTVAGGRGAWALAFARLAENAAPLGVPNGAPAASAPSPTLAGAAVLGAKLGL